MEAIARKETGTIEIESDGKTVRIPKRLEPFLASGEHGPGMIGKGLWDESSMTSRCPAPSTWGSTAGLASTCQVVRSRRPQSRRIPTSHPLSAGLLPSLVGRDTTRIGY